MSLVKFQNWCSFCYCYKVVLLKFRREKEISTKSKMRKIKTDIYFLQFSFELMWLGIQRLWVQNDAQASVLRWPLNANFHRLSQSRCYFSRVEVQGISHQNDWCVREDEEPAFKDGYALMTLNSTINHNNQYNNNNH